MRRKRFFHNIAYISLFGICGTLVTFIVNVLGAYIISGNNWIVDNDGSVHNLTGQELLLIGIILSASDAVASCSMIEEEDSPKINSILLGAGVINEAVVLVLFNSASGSFKLQGEEIATLFGKFLGNLLASIVIGIGFGVVSAIMTKYIKKFEKYPSYETALLFFLAYIGYFIAEMLTFPGVISILCSGIVMGHYTWYNLSIEARIVSRAAFTIVGELLMAFIFVYVGFSTYSLYGHDISFDFIGLMTLVLMFGRFLGIVVIPGILKLLFKRRFILKWKELAAIWFVGCIRGAIAFALVVSVAKVSDLIKTTILGIVLLTTIVFGAIMPFLKTFILSLRISNIGNSQRQESLLDQPFVMEAGDNDPPSLDAIKSRPSVHVRWKKLDNRYLKPWFMKATAIARQPIAMIDLKSDAGTQTSAMIDLKTDAGTQTSAMIDLKSDSGTQTPAMIDLKSDAGTQTPAMIDLKSDASTQTQDPETDVPTSTDNLLE